MSKKWYNLFVSVESDGASQGTPTGPPPNDAARAVADIAASLNMGAPAASADAAMERKVAAAAAPPPAAAAAAPGASPKLMSFAEIYSAAEIGTPAHGYTVLKVAEMLQSPHIKDLPSEVRRSSVLVALDAAGVKVATVVEDAIRRDKALDAFERVQQKVVDDFETAKLEENRKLQAELDKLTAEYKAKIQANSDASVQRRESLAAWRVQKQIEEQKIADCVGYFVSENPITTSRTPAAAPPPATPPKP